MGESEAEAVAQKQQSWKQKGQSPQGLSIPSLVAPKYNPAFSSYVN